MDCKALTTEQTSLVKEAEILGALVDQEYSSDKNKELVAWVLFTPVLLTLRLRFPSHPMHSRR